MFARPSHHLPLGERHIRFAEAELVHDLFPLESLPVHGLSQRIQRRIPSQHPDQVEGEMPRRRVRVIAAAAVTKSTIITTRDVRDIVGIGAAAVTDPISPAKLVGELKPVVPSLLRERTPSVGRGVATQLNAQHAVDAVQTSPIPVQSASGTPF
jgi:hypothetical protein